MKNTQGMMNRKTGGSRRIDEEGNVENGAAWKREQLPMKEKLREKKGKGGQRQ